MTNYAPASVSRRLALLPYLLPGVGSLGILICTQGTPDREFLLFHARRALNTYLTATLGAGYTLLSVNLAVGAAYGVVPISEVLGTAIFFSGLLALAAAVTSLLANIPTGILAALRGRRASTFLTIPFWRQSRHR